MFSFDGVSFFFFTLLGAELFALFLVCVFFLFAWRGFEEGSDREGGAETEKHFS